MNLRAEEGLNYPTQFRLRWLIVDDDPDAERTDAGDAPTLARAPQYAASGDLLSALDDLVALVEMESDANEVGTDLWAAVFAAKQAARKATEGKPA